MKYKEYKVGVLDVHDQYAARAKFIAELMVKHKLTNGVWYGCSTPTYHHHKKCFFFLDLGANPVMIPWKWMDMTDDNKLEEIIKQKAFIKKMKS